MHTFCLVNILVTVRYSTCEVSRSIAVPPEFFEKNDSVVEAKPGESITLVGMATGEPIPNITWVRDDGSLMKLPDGRTAVSVRVRIILNHIKKTWLISRLRTH